MKPFRFSADLLAGFFSNVQQGLGQGLSLWSGGSLPVARDGIQLLRDLQQTIFDLDPAYFLRVLNPGWRTLTGHAPGMCLGANFLEYVHLRDRGQCREYFRQLSKGGQVGLSPALRIVHCSGDTRWVILRANLVYVGKDGEEEVSGIVGTLVDITSQVQEEEIRNARHRSLGNLVNNLPVIICRSRNDKSRTMEYISDGCRKILSYEPWEIINNRCVSYNDLIYPDDRERLWNEIQSKVLENQHFELIYRVVAFNKKVKWVLELGQGVYSKSGMLLNIESAIYDVTDRRQTELRWQMQSLYDAETALPNPNLFLDRLQHIMLRHAAWRHLQKGHLYVLMLVGIDGFKKLQHKQGPSLDALMYEIGKGLHDLVGETDSLARLEGDKFGVLLEDIEDFGDLIMTVRRIQEQVQTPILLQGQEYHLNASIGIVIGNEEYRDANLMLVDSYTALGRARSLGGRRYEVLDPQCHAKLTSESKSRVELERALEQGEFLVHWEPVVSLDSGHLAALEARLAWPHRHRGILYAEQFIPPLLNARVLAPLWEWMFHEITRQINSWWQLGGIDPAQIDIQISGATLLDMDSILHLGESLLFSAKEIQPFGLTIGVSEELLLRDLRTNQDLLRRIKQQRGIRLLLSSFGAGTTSLLGCHEYIDCVRIDESLLKDGERGCRRLGALIRLVQELGMQTMVRNLPDVKKLPRLSALGVDYLQGEPLSVPMESHQILKALEDRKRVWLPGHEVPSST